jgi:hypothetical protein
MALNDRHLFVDKIVNERHLFFEVIEVQKIYFK